MSKHNLNINPVDTRVTNCGSQARQIDWKLVKYMIRIENTRETCDKRATGVNKIILCIG